MHDMESKYKPYLNNEDYVHNTEIAQGLFDICQATPSLGAVIAKNGASFGRFVLAYTGVKHENLMWTVDGKYFPFLAITTEETLELLLQGNAVSSFNMNILRGIFKTYNAEQTGRQFANNNNNTAPIDTVTYNQTVAQVPASSSSIVSNLAGMNIKKVWILVFLVISLGMMYFAPYHTVLPNNKGEEFAGYGTISEMPSSVSGNMSRYTSIDYTTLAFHEVVLLVVCGAGFTITSMVIQKK